MVPGVERGAAGRGSSEVHAGFGLACTAGGFPVGLAVGNTVIDIAMDFTEAYIRAKKVERAGSEPDLAPRETRRRARSLRWHVFRAVIALGCRSGSSLTFEETAWDRGH